MNDKLTITGRIGFEPVDISKKHESQAPWKRVAMVFIDGDIAEYYAWYIKKRYSLELVKPLRGAHVSFINDSNRDLSLNNTRTPQQISELWNRVKNKWDGKEIPIMLDLTPRTDGKHWWLNIPPEYRDRLQGIRSELGLKKPFFGLHMSIGYANQRNLAHSEYIHTLIKSGLIK